MIRYLVSGIFLIVCLVWPRCVQAVGVRTGIDVVRDQRIVGDLRSFPFLAGQRQFKLPGQAEQAWVLVEIKPSAQNARISHLAEEGQVPARSFRIYDGVYRSIASLEGDVKEQEWKYEFKIQISNTGHGYLMLNTEQLAPYCNDTPSLAICSVQKEDDGHTTISRCYLLPTEWQEFVQPAFKFIKAHGNDTFSYDITGRSYEELTHLLNDKNPLIGIAAAQALSLNGFWHLIDLDTLGQSNDLRLAIFSYWHFIRNDIGVEEQTLEFNDYLKSVNAASKLEPLALGLLCFYGSKKSYGSVSYESLRSWFLSLQKKQDELTDDPKSKERIKLVSIYMGIR